MVKSIENTQKLFKIEGLEDGKVEVEASQHLLSLPGERQIEVLTAHLTDLRKDLERVETLCLEEAEREGAEIHRAQLRILIQVIEGLLSRI